MVRPSSSLAALLVGAAACSSMSKPTQTPRPAWPEIDETFIAQSAATRAFRLGHPFDVQVTPAGDVLFARTGPRTFVADLYQRDAATGEVTRLLAAETLLGGGAEQLSAEEKARRERMRQATRGIAGYQLSEDGRRLLVPLSDRLFVVDRPGGAVRELATGPGFPYDPRLSRAGDRVAYVVDADLWVIDVAGGAPRRLTTRPAPAIEHAVAEFVAQEEMGRTRGYWWSPDGTRIAYQRSDLSRVDTLWVADPARPDRPPTPFRYPRAGTADAEVTLGVIPVAGGATTWIEWDRARWPYLCRVVWDDGGPLTLIVMNRAQTELAVLAADPDRGGTTELVTERDPAWLNLPSQGMPRWLPDGSGFLWMTERRGAWQLELRAAGGELLRELTDVGFGLQAVAGLDGEAAIAWVIASPDPTQSHVWRVPLAGAGPGGAPAGAPRRISEAEGVYGAAVAPRGGWLVTSASERGGALRGELRDRDGAVVATLPSVAEEPPWMPNVEWTTVAVDGRDHHAAIIRPRAFEPGRRYPVLLHVYGGPHARMVAASARGYLVNQWYADAGFVVVVIDGRGTPHRGRDWERAIHRDLVTLPLADQIAVLTALGARHRELDLARVGVYGWSFGGYVSAMAVLLRPDVFRAAVAGAPVTDWALYDTFYTERYMQTPAANPEGYRQTSAVTHAARLERPLLLVHGTTDDNVHFAHAMALVEALFRAGRRVELLPVSATHMTPDPELALALYRRQLAFFREALE
jgi:dipeptidyl-peptidase 4